MANRERYYLEWVRRFGPIYPGFDLPATELALNILFTYDVLQQCTAKYMAEFGLSRSAFNVLTLLKYCSQAGMQLHDLGEMLLVSRANITGLVSHLEELGYVTREVNEQDRRARYAKLTPDGEEILNRLMPVHYSNVAALMGNLSDMKKDQLIHLLSEVRESIQQHSSVCDPIGAGIL